MTTQMNLAKPRVLPAIHVFSFRGDNFVFFISTGDLLQVSEPTAQALRNIERGLSRHAWQARLTQQYGSTEARKVLTDIDSIESAGLLEPEVRITPVEESDSFDRLQAHQPRNIMLFVTEACNLKCTYCYEMNQGVHDVPTSLKKTDATKIIDAYFDGSSRRKGLAITFFGGEPLLNPKLIRNVVRYAKAKGEESGQQVSFSMTTNLTLLDESMAEFLASERFHVMVSIDGDKNQHDKHRVTKTGEGTYDRVTANLRLLTAKMKAVERNRSLRFAVAVATCRDR